MRDAPPHRSSFTTRAQAEFHSGGRKRLLGALVLALIALAALIIFGPEEDAVKARFEYYGAPDDEMRIMDEISIDDGRDRTEKIPQSLRIPPPPARLEIEDDRPDPDGTDIIEEQKEADPNRIDVNEKNPLADAEESERYQVEMSLPMQTSRDFFFLKKVLPEYPLRASERERRTPVIVVMVECFVNAEGDITAVVIKGSNGSEIFEEACVAAVEQWKLGWRVPPGVGRWLTFPINFRSPYFSPGR